MRKSVLFAIAISLSGCAQLPKVPRHVQYGTHADVNPPGFYGVDNESSERVYRTFQDPHMKAAQCLSVDDYRSFQAWVSQVKEIAEQRCR